MIHIWYLVKSNYQAETKNVNFVDDSERQKTLREINVWVEKKTNDKIKDLLTQSDLTSLTRLVLVNAIYFYGDWENPFQKSETVPNDFLISEKNKVKVPFMNETGRYNYYEDSKIKAIEMPYKGNKASMVIFLPNAYDGIIDFEKIFDFNYYQDIISTVQSNQVRLSFPKFQTTFKINLGNTLSQMGMPLAFSPGAADFSGMTGNKDLCISEVIHQAFIDMTEKGTEAAASTAVIMKYTSVMPSTDIKIFNADHPFVFVIKDNQSGSILFMGKIMNPGVLK